MRYLIIYEDGEFFQTDKVTDEEINVGPDHISIIDTKTMTSLSYDGLSWEPIDEWK